MAQFSDRGRESRQMVKELVLEYMRSVPDCGVNSKGVKQAVIFRECGVDWAIILKIPHQIINTGWQRCFKSS